MWEVDQSHVFKVVDQVREQIVRCSNRNEIISFIKSGLPDIRPRKSGPVGPELDFSIWFAQIPHDEVGKRGLFPTRELRSLIPRGGGRKPRGYKWTEKYTLHSQVETLWGGLEGVQLWTEFAMKHGIQFDGTYRYKFPGKKSGGTLRKQTFERLKSLGLIPHGVRSEAARIRRAARRPVPAERRDAPVFRPRSFDPLPVVRSISASKMRENWWRGGHQCRWSEYRTTQVVQPVLRLFDGKRHLSEPPTIVLKAIFKLYDPARIRLYKEGKATVTTAEAPRWIVPPKEVPKPPMKTMRDALSERLKQIEESGFNDRYAWFNVNHLLSKTAV